MRTTTLALSVESAMGVTDNVTVTWTSSSTTAMGVAAGTVGNRTQEGTRIRCGADALFLSECLRDSGLPWLNQTSSRISSQYGRAGVEVSQLSGRTGQTDPAYRRPRRAIETYN